jgi:hypothetical protein
MDLSCISPFPDGREKIQSRPKAGREALALSLLDSDTLGNLQLLPSHEAGLGFITFIMKVMKKPVNLVNPVKKKSIFVLSINPCGMRP